MYLTLAELDDVSIVSVGKVHVSHERKKEIVKKYFV